MNFKTYIMRAYACSRSGWNIYAGWPSSQEHKAVAALDEKCRHCILCFSRFFILRSYCSPSPSQALTAPYLCLHLCALFDRFDPLIAQVSPVIWCLLYTVSSAWVLREVVEMLAPQHEDSLGRVANNTRRKACIEGDIDISKLVQF